MSKTPSVNGILATPDSVNRDIIGALRAGRIDDDQAHLKRIGAPVPTRSL
jgi:hypothetical protein